MGIGNRLKGWGNKKGPADRTEDQFDIDVNLTPEDTEEEIEFKVTHGAQVDAPEAALQPVMNMAPEGDDEEEVDTDLFKNIFSQMEEEDDSAVGLLIASLPDIAMEDVLEEARNLRSLMDNWSEA